MSWITSGFESFETRLSTNVEVSSHLTDVKGSNSRASGAFPQFRSRFIGGPVSRVRRFDHVGITVADLDMVTAFFVELGLEVEGRMFMEGEFVDTVIGIPNSRSEIVTLRLPDGGTKLELSSFIRPKHEPGSPDAMSNELGLRNIAFEVDDLQALVDRLAADGYGLVGGIGQYEEIWRMAYVRGPEGIIVALAQRID
jgi:catechol 2,3-dioxygenase-like lactoylglutathione lyase family enzyme